MSIPAPLPLRRAMARIFVVVAATVEAAATSAATATAPVPGEAAPMDELWPSHDQGERNLHGPVDALIVPAHAVAVAARVSISVARASAATVSTSAPMATTFAAAVDAEMVTATTSVAADSASTLRRPVPPPQRPRRPRPLVAGTGRENRGTGGGGYDLGDCPPGSAWSPQLRSAWPLPQRRPHRRGRFPRYRPAAPPSCCAPAQLVAVLAAVPVLVVLAVAALEGLVVDVKRLAVGGLLELELLLAALVPALVVLVVRPAWE